MVMDIAKQRNRLPLKVAFIDQEAEWENTIIYIRKVMYREDIKPYWFQMPIKIFNATSYVKSWLLCWNPDEEDVWMRIKEPISIKENIYGTDRFKVLFDNISRVEFKDKKTAHISGVRCEESPGRFVGLTASLCYKHITWGKKSSLKNQVTFYPLYDWSYTDIWKAIHDNKWSYNKIYDYQYRYGINPLEMRVSNLHHETAVHSLFYMQEVEPDTYNKLTKRLRGIDAATKFSVDDFFIYKLPFMFENWKEYRDYLLDKLIPIEHQGDFRTWFNMQDEEFAHLDVYEKIVKAHVNAMMANDYTGTKLKNLQRRYSDKMTRKMRDMRRESNGKD